MGSHSQRTMENSGIEKEIHLVLLTELLGEGRAHDLVANVRRGGEVRLAGLAPGRGNVCNMKKSATLVSLVSIESIRSFLFFCSTVNSHGCLPAQNCLGHLGR